MNPRIIVLIVAVIIVAGLTAFLARAFLLGQSPEPQQQAQQVETTRILVASKNLPMGHLMEAGDLVWADWPNRRLNGNYLKEDSFKPADFLGNVVRYGIAAGEPLTTGRVIAPGERGFLAAVLSPGMRAMTIPVTRVTGVSGFVFPGDRVDLILIHSVKAKTLNPSGGGVQIKQASHRAGVTVLQNVRVLAVDLRTNDQNRVPALGKSVTIEVSPKMAEAVAVAQRMGQLVLSLRSNTLQANGEIEAMSPDELGPFTEPQTFTWDYDVSELVYPIMDPDALEKLVVSRGSKSKTYVVGVNGVEERLPSDGTEDVTDEGDGE